MNHPDDVHHTHCGAHSKGMKGRHPFGLPLTPKCLPYKRTSHLCSETVRKPLETPPIIPPSGIFAIMSIDPFQVKRLFTMRVVSNGHPTHLGLEFNAQSKMTSLFRPWAEENPMKSPPEEMTSLYPDEQNPGSAEDSTARENKYKSVKEHMKKRSEKYLLKKLKVRTEKHAAEPEVTGLCDNVMTSFPVCCVPTEAYLPPLDCLLPRSSIPGSAFPPGAEYVDATLGQGLHPSVFEEYAKFLTEQQRIVSERSRKQRPKKFRCPHCHVGFSNNGQLKGHIRIHTGERPFKCDAESCGKSFTRNEELTRHRRIHSGLRPFPCSECGKRFGRKDHLKKHIKTHFQQRYQLVPILPAHCSYFYGL